VLQARDGVEALQTIREERPDLVLLDLMMPEMDGFAVLEAMREGETTCDIPVIVLTSQVLTEQDMSRLNQGVAAVLGKGMFTAEETWAHVENALARNWKLGSETRRLVRKAMAFVHEHYAESLSRERIAHHVGVSDDYLTRCFREETGVTPVTYLNRYRVNQARSLLLAGEQSITDIALGVGFSSASHFGSIFRREMGVSPSAYQRGERAETG
jgi:YesN/AraC family two-component response regulator